MRVPLEILRLILRHMVGVLPVKALLRARLVSYIFSNELEPLIPYSPHLEDNDLVYRRWPDFPYKGAFAQAKVDHHETAPCFFSTVVHDVLAHQSVATMPLKDNTELIAALIDTALFSSRRSTNRPSDLFHQSPQARFQKMHDEKRTAFITQSRDAVRSTAYEPLENTIFTARATRAIIRDDTTELNRLLERDGGTISLASGSYRLEVSALEVAAKIGSADIISLLIDYQYPLELVLPTEPDFGYVTNAVRFAASKDNLAALKCWLEGPSYDFTYDGIHTSTRKEAWGALYSITHRIDRLEVLAPVYGAGIFPRILCNAIRYGLLETVKWCLARGDAHVFKSGPRQKAPLWLAVHDCYPTASRYEILKVLLQFGFDPNERRAGVNNYRTLLHAAMKEYADKLLRLLVEYGADVNANAHGRHPLPDGQYKDKNKSPFALALEVPQDPDTVSLLLANGARRRWWWKGREYVYGDDETVIEHIEGVFRDLGFEEEEVTEWKIEHYVAVS
ncbi:hypothetical protein BJX64DRAFT_286027 [Aspergillus heterothallicus]